MATLTIKNFPDSLYEKLKEQARQERRSLAQQVTYILNQAVEKEKPLSLLGLEGLGKEIWEGVDPVEYVRKERDSWDR